MVKTDILEEQLIIQSKEKRKFGSVVKAFFMKHSIFPKKYDSTDSALA